MGAVIQEWESMWDNGGKMTVTRQERYNSRCYTEHLWLQTASQNLERMFLLYLKCKIKIDDLTLRPWTSSSVFDPASPFSSVAVNGNALWVIFAGFGFRLHLDLCYIDWVFLLLT